MVRTKLNIEQTKFLTAIIESKYWSNKRIRTCRHVRNILDAGEYDTETRPFLNRTRRNYIARVNTGIKEAIVKW